MGRATVSLKYILSNLFQKTPRLAGEGIEPSLTGYEPVMLPLQYPAIDYRTKIG
jgi:hypothetical protein